MLDTMQVQLLKRIAPSAPLSMSGEVYEGRSKLRVLLGDRLVDSLRGQAVLDFGCGKGAEAIELASTARSIYGLDILEPYLAAARASAELASVADRCTFASVPPSKPVDAILSIDSFEHFDDPAAILSTMYSLLRPGGRVLISFGPPWYHPLGGHLFSVFPWAHLIFSEAALCRWRAGFKSDGATRFREVEGGLNQMTIARFLRLVRDSRFRVDLLEPVPIRKLRLVHNRRTREFTTAVVRAVLVRPASN